MANILIDPSFETNDPAHVYEFGAARSTIWANTGTYSVRLPRLAPELVGAWWYQVVTGLTPGQVYPFGAWINFSQSLGETMEFRVNFDPLGTGSWDLVGSISGRTGIEYWEPPHPTATGTAMGFRLSNIASGPVHIFFADDVFADGAFDTMAMSKYTAIANLQTLLKTMTVANGYQTELAGRVYTRLFTPDDKVGTNLPYVCIPLVEDAETIEYIGGRTAQSKWRQPFWFFCADNYATDQKDSAAVTAAAKFRDDVIKVIGTSATLTGAVRDCQVVSIQSTAGVLNDYGEVQGFIELEQIGASSDYGA